MALLGTRTGHEGSEVLQTYWETLLPEAVALHKVGCRSRCLQKHCAQATAVATRVHTHSRRSTHTTHSPTHAQTAAAPGGSDGPRLRRPSNRTAEGERGLGKGRGTGSCLPSGSNAKVRGSALGRS